MSTPAATSPTSPAPKKSRFRPIRIALLLLLLALASLAEPRVFRAFVGKMIELEAWRSGVGVNVGSVGGSLFEPLVLTRSHWTFASKNGAATRIEVARAEAEFDWRSVLHGDFERWFHRLAVRGVSAKITLPHESSPLPHKLATPAWKAVAPRGRWMPMPREISASGVDFIVERGADYVRLEQSDFAASVDQPGHIRAAKMTIKQPWMHRTFRQVRGTTAMQATKLIVGDLVLDPGVSILNFSAELAALAKGQLNMDIEVGAFGGKIRAEAQTLAHERPLTIELTSRFEQIDLAKLATFLGSSDAAGGTVKQGQFNFRGAPRELDRASASLYLDASNFQWDSRQWDSLALAASLLNRRIQVAKLDLHQGSNRLNLSGEMSLPTADSKWWQNEFTCNIAAKIDDLTGLSALLLPEFKFVAGKANIDGSIRGRNQQFAGQLIVSGSHLRWRNAPIENLHAAVKLEGNECQVRSFEVFNAGDYVRGNGVVNILGATQYWGELHASIDELATYAAILQKPIVPEPLAGGAVVDWSGEGSAKGHSGKFLAHLRKLRSIGALKSQIHPIEADLEGSYGAGSMQFSRFALSDEESSFTANIGVGNKALSLQQIRLTHLGKPTLEGDALLPLDVWQAWPNTSLTTLLNDDTVSRVNLTATNLDLRRASQLAGWNFPVAGTVNGTLTASGAIAALKTDGKLTLADGKLPIGGEGDTISGLNATLLFAGTELSFENVAAQHRFGSVQLGGKIDFKNLRDPVLALQVTSPRATLPLFGAWRVLAESTVTLNLAGPISGGTVSGSAKVTGVQLGNPPEIGALWTAAAVKATPPIFTFTAEPWSAWKLDLTGSSEVPAPFTATSGTLAADVKISGTGAAPIVAGALVIRGLQATANSQPLTIDQATIVFSEAHSQVPSLDVSASVETLGEKFTALVFGPIGTPVHWVLCAPPLTEELARQALSTAATPLDLTKFPPQVHVTLRAPAELTHGVEPSEWAPIHTPPATAEAAVPASVPPAIQ